MFYKTRRQIVKYISKIIFWWKIYVGQLFVPPLKKTVFIDISNIALNRYIANLILFFKIEGYTVFIPNKIELIYKLKGNRGEFKYAHSIINNIKLGRPDIASIVISEDQLSNDYFSNFLNDYHNSKVYYVLMSQYPSHYSKNLIDENLLNLTDTRKNAIIMAGNIDVLQYNLIEQKGFFKIDGRRKTIDFLRENSENYLRLKNMNDLATYIKSGPSNKLLLIDTVNDFKILLKRLKGYLKKFNFYLALPGIEIPHSHNLIEAMLAGCIPILSKTYAALFNPPLKNQLNALVYEKLEELDKLIDKIEQMKGSEILLLRRNSYSYYISFLITHSIIKTIANNNFEKIYIQAENISLNYLKNKTIDC